MKGVDLLDQMVSYYQFKHRSKKWWRRLFLFFLSVSCYNSYIAARSAGAYKGCYKEWQEDLAQELVTPVTAKSAPQCATAPVAASAQHDCEKIYEKRKICRECSQSKNGTEARPGATVYGCRQCNVPLHIECFGKHFAALDDLWSVHKMITLKNLFVLGFVCLFHQEVMLFNFFFNYCFNELMKYN
jgi:hypothetical protein